MGRFIPAFIVKRHKDLDYVGKTAYCSRNGTVLKRNISKTKAIRAEVKRTESTRIVVLVKGNNQHSCEFGAELVGDLYDVIRRYKVFQNEQTKPAIKFCFTDKKGRPRSCEIEDVLENDSLFENFVEPSKWQQLKNMASSFGDNMRFKGKLGVNLAIGNIEAEVEYEPTKKEDV